MKSMKLSVQFCDDGNMDGKYLKPALLMENCNWSVYYLNECRIIEKDAA